MTVVHCKRESYDVYVGRGCCPVSGSKGEWGNPFRLTSEEERGATLERYRAWLWSQLQAEARDGVYKLHVDLADLHGKVLGCWCAPKPCHADVLVRAAAWAYAWRVEQTMLYLAKAVEERNATDGASVDPAWVGDDYHRQLLHEHPSPETCPTCEGEIGGVCLDHYADAGMAMSRAYIDRGRCHDRPSDGLLLLRALTSDMR